MSRCRGPRPAICLAALAGFALAGCAAITPVPAPRPLPRPGEGDGDRDRERQAWIESMHRTGPGVSWREIERANRHAAAQRLSITSAESNTNPRGFWRQRGPTGVTGRTWQTALAADDTTLLIGSGDENGGGLFSGFLDGNGWTQRGNALGTGVQEIVSVPGSPETWVAVTGGNTDLAVSSDQGITWQTPTGIPFAPCGWGVPRLLREAPPSRTVYALLTTLSCNNLPTLYYTLLRSTDGGLDFQAVIANTNFTATPDMWIDRLQAGPLYVLTDAGLKASSNHGATFVQVSGALPGSFSDLRLAGSEAGAPTLYAVGSAGSASTVFASLDAGRTWAQKQAFIHGEFFVPFGAISASLSTPKTVLLGGVNAYLSTDGGATFNKVIDWSAYLNDPETNLHADIRGIECISYHGSETFFVDTDGGTYISQNLGATFSNLTRTSMVNDEYYSTLTSKNDPDLIAAGSQDQGFQSSTPAASGLMGFTELETGDYGHLTSTNGDHNMLFAAYPGTTDGFVLVQTQESPPLLLRPECPPYPAARARAWMPFLLADPLDANAVYLTGDPLFRIVVDAAGCHATAGSQNFSNGNGDYLTALAILRVNPQYWYAASAQGKLWYSHNQGATWTLSAAQGPQYASFYGTTLAINPSTPAICWVGGSGYMGSAVFRSTDGGVTWQAMGAGLPATLVFGLAFDGSAEQSLYAATDAGPFVFDAASSTWVNIASGNAPFAGYWSVEAVPSLSIMRFGTFGKGIWDYTPTPPSLHFYTLPPCRILDTRLAAGPLGGPAIQASSNRVFAVAGTCGVPATAQAISVNITVAGPAATGSLTVGASDMTVAPTLNIAFKTGAVRANNARVSVAADGSGGIVVTNQSAGAVPFILDVNGYFQ